MKQLAKAERLSRIAEWVQEKGFVGVDDLSSSLDVSRMTIHRDLDELENSGALRKVRGGASAHRSTQFESSLNYRKKSAVDEKRKMAVAASKLINSGDVIILDDSTSSLALVPYLHEFEGLTVITNFVPVLNAVEKEGQINLICVGGQYHARYAAYFGYLSEEFMNGVYADILFASTSSMKGADLYHQDQRIVGIKRAMMKSAERRVLLMDTSKIDQGALYRLGSVSEFTDVILDSNVDESVVSQLRERVSNVIVT